jgi:1-acyl-sn-glycerol-3-phosphate acyltransferase
MSSTTDTDTTTKLLKKKKKNNNNNNDGVFINYCSLTQETMKLMCIDEKVRQSTFQPLSEIFQETSNTKKIVTQQLQEMTIIEEMIAIIVLLFGPPNGIFSIPIVTILIGKYCFHLTIVQSFYYLFIYLLLPLFILPQPYIPSTLTCYVSTCIIKYFSFRFISYDIPSISTTTSDKQKQVPRRPQILVAPPHGVFPYGNILALLIWPSIFGINFYGLAANAALRVPIFKQLLKSIGVIDASRQSALHALQRYPNTIGISTGGVAEVFETNSTDECILLKERIGLIKLAIRTGADIVPCYLFGNTHLLNCWSGEGFANGRTILERISRKIGFALILFYGRYYLPLPYRIPILGIRGESIQTHHYNMPTEPTTQQINTIQNQLINDMQKLFDNNKTYYGWDSSQLVIK